MGIELLIRNILIYCSREYNFYPLSLKMQNRHRLTSFEVFVFSQKNSYKVYIYKKNLILRKFSGQINYDPVSTV